jgi:molybdate transport system ATP-binding protein
MMKLNALRARLQDGRYLSVADWVLGKEQYWAIVGTSGSGKTALSCAFGGGLRLAHGNVTGLPERVAYVSLEAQAEQIERERQQDESDLTDMADKGTLVCEFLAPLDRAVDLIRALRIDHLLDQGIRSLSTGESRKILWVNRLLHRPDLLILDEAYEGVDQVGRQVLNAQLAALHQQGQAMLWVANRLDELPDWITHLAFIHDAELVAQGPKNEILALPEVTSLMHFDGDLPDFPPSPSEPLVLAEAEPLVRLKNGWIQYEERVLFKDLNWTIQMGEHWAIQGPNGCGKSSLLQMITGDNPMCYRNDLRLFGIQRGSGESIWDIKKHIGLVSSALQWEYRATTNVLSAVISGLHDSIGLYNKVGDDEKQLGLQWLDVLGLRDKANQSLQHLSYGEQRLVLIGRALIKQPPLLILDEPCQGLDDLAREMVLAFINRLAEQTHMTLLYVTHHPTEIPEAFLNRLSFVPDESGQSRVEVSTVS